jgi:hypothetical protein
MEDIMRKMIKDATTVKIYGYSFKPRSRVNIIEQANRNSVYSLLPKMETITQKQDLVRERMGDLFYMFGEVLVPSKGEYDEGQ